MLKVGSATQLKFCNECRRMKPREEFYVDRARPRGRVSRCKPCYARQSKIDYLTKPWKLLTAYKSNAKQRGVEFSLPRKVFESFWGVACHYCGGSVETISLDRIDNTKGYVEGNVVSCCSTCNGMKSALSVATFIGHCKKVALFNAAIARNE